MNEFTSSSQKQAVMMIKSFSAVPMVNAGGMGGGMGGMGGMY